MISLILKKEDAIGFFHQRHLHLFNLPKAGTNFDKRSIFVQSFDKNLQRNLKNSGIWSAKNPILAHKIT
jgi:hypothetical protein